MADITDNVRWNLDRGAVLTEAEARLLCGEVDRLRAVLAVAERKLTPYADGCMGTGEYKLCHDMSEAVDEALAAARGEADRG